MTHYNLLHKFVPMPQSMKIPNAKAAVDKERKKLETIPAWNLESQEQEGGYSGSTKRQKESPLRPIGGHLSPQERRVWTKITKNTKAESCSVVTLWKTTLEPMRFLLNRARLRPRRLPQKSCLHSGKIGGCSWIAQSSQIGMLRCLDTSSDEKLKIPWYVLNETWTVIQELDCCGREFEEALFELGWVKIPNWECMFVHRKQGLFFSENVDDIKMVGKKQNMAPMRKKKRNMWILTNPHHFLTMCT